MNRSLLNSPAGKTLGAFLFLALIATWVLWPKKLPPPDERNRIRHLDGYSIIMPPGWHEVHETAEHTLVKSNRGWLKLEPNQGGYFPPSIMILLLPDAPDPADLKARHFAPAVFHGQPAQISSGREKKYWAFHIIFKDHDRWFDMNVSTPDYYDVPSSSWWAYLDSFQAETEPVHMATAPTTAPKVEFTTQPVSALK